MDWSFVFFVNSILLGVGLAMDAFSVSLANGLNDSKMKKRTMCKIAGTFAFYQALMPMIGWICVHTVVKYFKIFDKIVPWIAFFLLAFIGGKMLVEGIRYKDNSDKKNQLTFGLLMMQGIATSIDALSVGFTIAEYNWLMALVCALIIAFVTLIICMVGLFLGRKIGTKLSGKASVFGGSILIGIGLEILITSFF